MKYHYLYLLLPALLIFNISFAQKEPTKIVAGIPVNYKEDSVGTYTLPNPLLCKDGETITTNTAWLIKRRPEIVQLYEEYQFGKMPEMPSDMRFVTFDKGTFLLNGKAIRKQVTIYFTKDSLHKMDLLIYLPTNTTKPVPLLLNISFTANCNTIKNDTTVSCSYIWTKDGRKILAQKTGDYKFNCDIEPFINAGFGVATVYYGDIEPDFKEGIQYGIRSIYLKQGQTQPAANEWGAIAAWAWGLSRAMDYIETDKQIDAKRVALFGVSRLGKTVLWTGAHDTRFAMIIANCSGEGGAALSRRNYGETIKMLASPTRYAYQFCGNYQHYGDSVNKLPVDGHMLISLIAPRPLLLETGDTDYWSDPKGEFLAAVAATPVYHLFNKQGMENATMPLTGQAVLNTLGYSMHSGGHGTVPTDWTIALDFMKKYLLNK